MKPFEVQVSSPEEAVKVLDVLAQYDLFCWRNKVWGDYSNAAGLRFLAEIEHGQKLQIDFNERNTPNGEFDLTFSLWGSAEAFKVLADCGQKL